MEFALNEEQQMLQDSVRRLVSERAVLPPSANTAPQGFPEDWWRECADLGWFSVLIPEEDGGLGWSVVDASVLTEEFGRGVFPMPYASAVVAPSVLLAGAAAGHLRSSLLEGVSNGDMRLAVAAEEAQSRYNILNCAATARRTNGGWALTGTKILVHDGVGASGYLVTAVPEGGDAPAVFWLPEEATGLEIRPYRTLDGRPAADLLMSGAEVGADGVVLGPEEAMPALDKALDQSRLMLAAEAVGTMERAIADTRDYIVERKQFGRPISEFQVLRHRLAEMFVAAENARAMLLRGLSFANSPAPDRGAAVSATMLAVTDAGETIGGNAVQLHGGIGMTEEYLIGHCYKRLRVIGMTWGDSAFHLARYQELTTATRGEN